MVLILIVDSEERMGEGPLLLSRLSYNDLEKVMLTHPSCRESQHQLQGLGLSMVSMFLYVSMQIIET